MDRSRRLALAALVAFAALTSSVSAQQLIFADGLETGDPGAWSTVEPPFLVSCNCYFSNDCTAGFCSYGPGGPATEDICNWRVPKPQGQPGMGCSEDHLGPWGPVCDGLCVSASAGSPAGREDRFLVAQAIRLWGEAMLLPAAAGGGPVDPDLARQAQELPFASPVASLTIAREAVAALVVAADFAFYDAFCHFEHGDPSPDWWVDLAVDPCRLAAGRAAIDALAAEAEVPGSGSALLAPIPAACAGRRAGFGPPCRGIVQGEGAVGCLADRIAGSAQFLTTAPGGSAGAF